MKNAFQTTFSCRRGKSRLTPLFEICGQKTGVSSLVWTVFGCFKPYLEGRTPLKNRLLGQSPEKPDLAPRIRRLCRERSFLRVFPKGPMSKIPLNPGRERPEGSRKPSKISGKPGSRGRRTPVFAQGSGKSCVLAVFSIKFGHL